MNGTHRRLTLEGIAWHVSSVEHVPQLLPEAFLGQTAEQEDDGVVSIHDLVHHRLPQVQHGRRLSLTA